MTSERVGSAASTGMALRGEWIAAFKRLTFLLISTSGVGRLPESFVDASADDDDAVGGAVLLKAARSVLTPVAGAAHFLSPMIERRMELTTEKF